MAGPRFNLKGYDPDYDANKIPKNRAGKQALAAHAMQVVHRATRAEEKLQQRTVARETIGAREQAKRERSYAKTRAKLRVPCTIDSGCTVPCCGWRVEFIDGWHGDGLMPIPCAHCVWDPIPQVWELERLPEVQAELARVRAEVAVDG